MKNLDTKLQLEELIKIYEEEARDTSDEFSHGDGLAKSETYKKVIKDLRYVVDSKFEANEFCTFLLDNGDLITGRVDKIHIYKVIVDCSDKYKSNTISLDKDKIKSFIKLNSLK